MAATRSNPCLPILLLATFGLLLTSCMAGNTLISGQSLGTGGALSFADHQFIMQSDCNLVLYSNGNPIWASNTNGRGSGCTLAMQTDGNLVVYASGHRAVWASNTNYGYGRYQLILQSDGNVVVYNPQGKPIWATGTNGRAATDATLPSAGKLTNVTVVTPEGGKMTAGNPIDGKKMTTGGN